MAILTTADKLEAAKAAHRAELRNVWTLETAIRRNKELMIQSLDSLKMRQSGADQGPHRNAVLGRGQGFGVGFDSLSEIQTIGRTRLSGTFIFNEPRRH